MLAFTSVFGAQQAPQQAAFNQLDQKIQSLQDTVPGLLSSLEQSLQSQMKDIYVHIDSSIANIQGQIEILQQRMDKKLADQSVKHRSSVLAVSQSFQSSVADLQAQDDALHTNTIKQLNQLNKQIANAPIAGESSAD